MRENKDEGWGIDLVCVREREKGGEGKKKKEARMIGAK